MSSDDASPSCRRGISLDHSRYDPVMGKDREGVGDYARQFFTNWKDYEGPASKKVWLTLRNRWRSVATLKGCCGHPGEPGC